MRRLKRYMLEIAVALTISISILVFISALGTYAILLNIKSNGGFELNGEHYECEEANELHKSLQTAQ